MSLLIVSNRLPFTLVKTEGGFGWGESVGGLAQGVQAYIDRRKVPGEVKWIGWPGVEVEKADRGEICEEALRRFCAVPLFFSQKEMDKFYYGFCNKTVWPLFHYFTTYAQFREEYFEQYRKINREFAESIRRVYREGDTIWIHDYQLMLLPRYLREMIPGAKIGFFLHIPFPEFEVFRLLPSEWREQILEGVLGADLVGFHNDDYCRYFLRCVSRILGVDDEGGKLFLPERVCRVESFPMGIDYGKFSKAGRSLEVREKTSIMKNTFKNQRVILSIDRLDYSKGIVHRLKGYEYFLRNNPKWRGKVVLEMVVVPSREKVEYFQRIKKQIDGLVGQINGEYGTLEWVPLHYHYTKLSFTELVALYGVSDIGLVTPLRDGMNLVAKEYVAAKKDRKGVLILSEMAGAAKELREAIIINPNNVREISYGLSEALAMSVNEKKVRFERMQRHIKKYNVVDWAERFLGDIEEVAEENANFNNTFLSREGRERIIENFARARNPLLLLDYDGTLVPFYEVYYKAVPGLRLKKLLRKIQDSGVEAAVISGRDRELLGKWLSRYGVHLIAEHGVWRFDYANERWEMTKDLGSGWKQQVKMVMGLFADRVPGALIEEKQFTLVWHYRRADPEIAAGAVKELVDELSSLIENKGLEIIRGNKVIEVKPDSINKGVAAMQLVSHGDYDFILAMGDDKTDEDMFVALPDWAVTVKVRKSRYPTHAKWQIRFEDVLGFLEEVVGARGGVN